MWSWRHFVWLAERLEPQDVKADYADYTDSDVARLRSAISRAYYAVYHITQEYMLSTHNITKTHKHKEYWESLRDNQALSLDERLVARHGLDLRTRRQYADYDNPYIDLSWEKAGQEAQRKKLRQRLTADAKASITGAYHVCLLLKRPLPRGPKTPNYIPAELLAP
jgi:uncharacterized protein (UPF0332 family)